MWRCKQCCEEQLMGGAGGINSCYALKSDVGDNRHFYLNLSHSAKMYCMALHCCKMCRVALHSCNVLLIALIPLLPLGCCLTLSHCSPPAPASTRRLKIDEQHSISTFFCSWLWISQLNQFSDLSLTFWCFLQLWPWHWVTPTLCLETWIYWPKESVVL